jgi:hypothetical protein
MSELLFNFTGTEAKWDAGTANILIQSASSNISFQDLILPLIVQLLPYQRKRLYWNIYIC